MNFKFIIMNLKVFNFFLFLFSFATSQTPDCPSAAKQLCKNGATCIVRNNNYYCICTENFNGPDCSVPITTASSLTQSVVPTTTSTRTQTTTTPFATPCLFTNICQNSGACYIVNNAIRCECKPGFSGTFCEEIITTTSTTTTTTTTTTPLLNLCPFNNICQNGGLCHIVDNGIRCECKSGFSGAFCDTIVTTTGTTTTATIATATTATATTTTATTTTATTTTATTTTATTTTATTTTATVPPLPSCPSGSTTCKNGATCFYINGLGEFCQCTAEYTGKFCDIIVTSTTTTTTTTTTSLPSCSSNPCLNGATCFYINGFGEICQCTARFVGKFCEFDTFLISTTTTTTTTTTATVPEGFVCSYPSRCLNGASCFKIEGFGEICQCTPGFAGTFCDIPITTTTISTVTTTTTTSSTTETIPPDLICPTNPCKNNATCVKIPGFGEICQCASGFAGKFCEITVTTTTISTTSTTATTTTTTTTTTTAPTVPPNLICYSSPCKNGATCFNIKGLGEICQCTSQYIGQFCETLITTTTTTRKVEFCDSNPCLNDGECIDDKCFCSGGYSGLFCESKGCQPNPCTRGGTCFLDSRSRPKCDCATAKPYLPPDEIGAFCEIKTQFSSCDSNPCKNGGNCVEEDDSTAICFCPSGTSGSFCQYKGCESNPCLNGGKCIETATDKTIKCQCEYSFTGKYCENLNLDT